MGRPALLLALAAGVLAAQQPLPTINGESLSGRKVTLPAAAEGRPALLIAGFTHASQTQTKDWSRRVRDQFPFWSIAVLEEVPHLVRGMVVHAIKGSIPKELYDRFLVVDHGEAELKRAAGFDRPDDAYLIVIDSTGAVRWRYHGPVTDAAMEQLSNAFRSLR